MRADRRAAKNAPSRRKASELRPAPRASVALMLALPCIALCLRNKKCYAPTDHDVDLGDEHVLEFYGKDGRFYPLTEDLTRELAEILMAVLGGADARKAFRQDERRKPKKPGRYPLALVYYYLRACGENPADDSAAIEAVRAAKMLEAPASASTIRRYARAHRDAVLDSLAEDAGAREGAWRAQLVVFGYLQPQQGFARAQDEGVDLLSASAAARAILDEFVPPIEKKDITRLRDHLAEKSRKGPET